MNRLAAVLGASGYAGGELVRLLDGHPGLDVVHLGAHTRQGEPLARVHPQLGGGERVLASNRAEDVPDVDVAFLALPHGSSAVVGRALHERGILVVDLGSDFRFDTPERYRSAYGADHPLPEELASWRYGLPELFDLAGADRVAAPGCYPTAVLLAATPLLRGGAIAGPPLVADCMSGATGAGRTLREDLLFGSVDEGVRAYAVTSHRHRPEIEMGLDLALGGTHRVVFTPHLVPMQRGLLATVTAPASPGVTSDSVREALVDFYRDRPFVEVIDVPPQTRWVVGSNRALVAAFHDGPTGTVIAQAAIDNLGKGAAGQAVQAANLALGLPETDGLPVAGWLP